MKNKIFKQNVVLLIVAGLGILLGVIYALNVLFELMYDSIRSYI